ARVELSLDGGQTYNIVLAEYLGTSTRTPYANFLRTNIDLSSYLGMPNLKIRFNYRSTNASSWAIDNIAIPDAPVDGRMEWVDEQTGEVISTSENTTVTPLTPGVNYYRVTSYINGCRSFGDAGTEI